jgi:hypothetical protein
MPTFKLYPGEKEDFQATFCVKCYRKADCLNVFYAIAMETDDRDYPAEFVEVNGVKTCRGQVKEESPIYPEDKKGFNPRTLTEDQPATVTEPKAKRGRPKTNV